MPTPVIYEIFVRKGKDGGPFNVEDEAAIQNFAKMCGIAKGLVDKGEVDEAVVLEKRVLKRYQKYSGQG